MIGSTPWSVPAPFTLNTDAVAILGYTPVTTYQGSVGKTCDWLVAQSRHDWRTQFPILASYPRELFDYSTDDRLLATDV
ncbi:hypothetical protein MESS2_1140039 [Mesorhizobium metallidurans STM 2683]|uniref:Uncharacterized protein n=1 Tax=Mesorhizobium metallidurans STM 2683 TaxID=1297569 RepID=M5EH03_9HYPH|nr:hypothetical protein MESS2_1140039 [Mesorhizobium metallidurans STM 2683]